MPASIVTTAEVPNIYRLVIWHVLTVRLQVVALTSLRPNHLTLSGSVLAKLAGASPLSSAELAERPPFGAGASGEIR